jgi:hypothetical protein
MPAANGCGTKATPAESDLIPVLVVAVQAVIVKPWPVISVISLLLTF